MQVDLDANFRALQWVVNAYALLLGGLILVGGGAGDRFDRSLFRQYPRSRVYPNKPNGYYLVQANADN